MLTATAVGVVHDEDVTRRHFSTILQGKVLHRVWESAQLHGQRQALGDYFAGTVAQGRRIVHRIAHDGRIGTAHEHQSHLVSDRRQSVLEHFKGNGVNALCHGVPASITILPWASSIACALGGTMQVESNSSTMNGPAIPPASAPRETTGVSINKPLK